MIVNYDPGVELNCRHLSRALNYDRKVFIGLTAGFKVANLFLDINS